MKVLILSCNTGQGHNSAANAVRDVINSLGHECIVKDALAFASSFFSKGVSGSYNSIVMHTPKAFGVGYRASKRKTYTPGKTKSAVYAINMMYSKKLYYEILKEGYDAVLCTHVFPAQAMTHVKHKYGLKIPLYVIATDYAFCPFYDELDVSNYFISMEAVRNEFIARGISEDKIIPTGIPVSAKFNTDISKNEARLALGLNLNKFLCIIMSGSMGFGNIYGFIDKVLDSCEGDYEILVIAGKNEKLRRGITEKYEMRGNVAAIGFTDKVHLYMKACDLVVTKPGGLSSTESMVSNVPLILTNPIPGCETENYDILTSKGVAVGGKDVDKAVAAFGLIYNDSILRQQIIDNQKKYINKNSARDISVHVLKGLGVEIDELCGTGL